MLINNKKSKNRLEQFLYIKMVIIYKINFNDFAVARFSAELTLLYEPASYLNTVDKEYILFNCFHCNSQIFLFTFIRKREVIL